MGTAFPTAPRFYTGSNDLPCKNLETLLCKHIIYMRASKSKRIRILWLYNEWLCASCYSLNVNLIILSVSLSTLKIIRRFTVKIVQWALVEIYMYLCIHYEHCSFAWCLILQVPWTNALLLKELCGIVLG